ncbi:MAG: thioredoxin domain-containing protein [Betaproteobacteria bacterium]
MANRLAQETSPYLQQHAGNPVDWYPWGEEALALAREHDKPILLSIGYSACHWCHVMAHESFEDAETAAEMNRLFVNIKVDREERPDLDQIYQNAHHLLTQRSGGWPLTMFLMPDGTPYFGGTYFPDSPRYGMPAFRDLLARVATAYHEKREDIARQNQALLDALSRTVPSPGGAPEMADAPLRTAVREYAQAFDDVQGGIGRAPKFPHPHEFAYCLRRYALDASEFALTMVRLTLTRMAEGGVFDQIGGGFYRYSVDGEWTIPHFEKMLYDNGPLLALYSDAWRVTRDPLYAAVAARAATWAMREMQSPEGGYYSSLDADSEHEEGKFYVWTPQEAKALLTPDEYALVEPHYGLDGAPNFEGRSWHLRVRKPLAYLACKLGVSTDECAARLDAARAKLYDAREKRVHPGRDEKILTSWNALMIRGMARAAQVFGERTWLASAQRAADFLRDALWRDGRLLATYKDGRAHLNAYLDDHAFLLDALLELMQADFRSADLDFARALADVLLDNYEDRVEGGFYFVSHDHERLIVRPKSGQDSATPSGNGIAACALQRLGHLIGEPRYLAAAGRTLKAFYPALERQPSSFPSLATALDEYLRPPRIVILRGAIDEIKTWQRALSAACRPDTMIVALAGEAAGLPAALAKPARPAPAAWICRGTACLAPIAQLNAVESALAGG